MAQRFTIPDATEAGARRLADETGERVMLVVDTTRDPSDASVLITTRTLVRGEAAIARQSDDLTYLSRDPASGVLGVWACVYAPRR